MTDKVLIRPKVHGNKQTTSQRGARITDTPSSPAKGNEVNHFHQSQQKISKICAKLIWSMRSDRQGEKIKGMRKVFIFNSNIECNDISFESINDFCYAGSSDFMTK